MMDFVFFIVPVNEVKGTTVYRVTHCAMSISGRGHCEVL